MTTEEYLKICDKAIKKYGEENQIIKAVEELSELSQALCKLVAKPLMVNRAQEIEHISEEIGDVQVMLIQLIRIFNNAKQCEKWQERKLERLKMRMEASE